MIKYASDDTLWYTIGAAYENAETIQYASNPSGVLHSAMEMASAIRAELDEVGLYSTKNFGRHPIFTFYASKLHDLAGLGISNEERYGKAHNHIQAILNGHIVLGSEEYLNNLRAYFG